MNFLQRAFKNTTRKWSKTILLLITFFLIGNFVIIGLGVSQASDSAKTLTRQKMRAVVTYGIDYEAISEYTDSITDEDELEEFYNERYPRINVAEIKDILKDESVIAANATSIHQGYAPEGLDYVKLDNKAEQNAQENAESEMEDIFIQPNFSIKSNFFPNMIEIQDKTWDIVEGNFYTQEDIDNKNNVCLITQALAELNGIKVGDTISINLMNPKSLTVENPEMEISEEDVALSMEVIGIYNHNNPITPDMEGYDWISGYDNPDNTILMPATTLNKANVKITQKIFDFNKNLYPEDEYYNNDKNRPNEDVVYINNVTLLLNDPLEVDNFINRHEANISEFKELGANNEEFERLSKPLDTLSLYANFIVWLVVINAIVIITLVTALTLKTREYEIGVLLSIGASKVKIIGQFFAELAIVAILGFTLSVVSGSLIANKVGQTVLDYQITASDVVENTDTGINFPSVWDEDYTTDITLDDLVSEYSVSISPLLIGEIYVLGLGIVLISIIIPSAMIMRYNPKQILMNKN